MKKFGVQLAVFVIGSIIVKIIADRYMSRSTEGKSYAQIQVNRRENRRGSGIPSP